MLDDEVALNCALRIVALFTSSAPQEASAKRIIENLFVVIYGHCFMVKMMNVRHCYHCQS